MIPKSGSLLAFLLFLSLLGNAQKTKYKDVFILLNAREYAKAEPFLKRYLNENKGDETPSSFLFMGLIDYDKAYKNDVLKEAAKLESNTDSSLLFLGKAKVAITEKEAKRNDDYYEMYRRRDLRTAESGIKWSDIQFDIDKRIKDLKERKEHVKTLNDQFNIARDSYQKANDIYRQIQAAYPALQEFYLQSDENSLKELKRMLHLADSSSRSFSSFKTTLSILGRTGYSQSIDLIEIKDLKRDGASMADFYENDLKLWDYRKWASSGEDILEKEIFPLRDGLIACDVDINKLQTKLKKDSVLEYDELQKIFKRPLLAHLSKYDPDPLPIAMFRMKAAEMEYSAQLMHSRKIKDSTNVTERLNSVRLELKKANALDSIAALLSKRDIAKEAVNYSYFITAIYGNQDVLNSLIRTTKDYGDRQKTKKKKEEDRRMNSLRWLLVAADSVPLFTEAPPRPSKFKPLVIVPDDHTIGMKYADSLSNAYFYSITPNRIPDIKAIFPVPAVAFNKRNLPIIKGMTARDEKGQVYFALIYSEAKTKDKFTAVVAKIYRTDGLAWSKTYALDMLPVSMNFASDTGELSIKVTSPAGDNKIVVIDKSGKQLQ